MECPICYSCAPQVTLVCGHCFCNECTKEWYLKCQHDQPSCPMCRGAFYFKGMRNTAKQWDEERIDKQYQQVFEKVFEELLEDFQDMEFLCEMQERYQLIYNDDFYCTEDDLYYLLSDIFFQVNRRERRGILDVVEAEPVLIDHRVSKHPYTIRKKTQGPQYREHSDMAEMYFILDVCVVC